VILDTNKNIFGGFTPVKWESRISASIGDRSNWKTDESLKSFLFTLKNPHNIPARKFGLKVETKEYTIYCNSGYGPSFRDGCAFAVSQNCNTHTGSSTYLGDYDTNDTELDERIVLTGLVFFKWKKSKSFRLNPKQHFTQILLVKADRTARIGKVKKLQLSNERSFSHLQLDVTTISYH
jgi:hypothetical protein